MNNYPLSEDRSEQLYYQDNAFPFRTWKAYAKDFPALTYVNHWHNEFEFAFIRKGTMNENINGQVLKLKEGDLLFVNSRAMHFGFWDEPSDCEFICMVMHPLLIMSGATESDNEVLVGNAAPPYLLFQAEDPETKQLAGIFMSLHEQALYEKQGSYEIMAEIYRLFSELLKKIRTVTGLSASERRQIEIMHRITGFIQRRYSEKITLDDIAAAGMVSKSKCGTVFKRFLGKTPMEYLSEYRILRSAELLRDTGDSVSQIALKCGFAGASYYTEKFTEMIGITPTDYRKQEIGKEEKRNIPGI